MSSRGDTHQAMKQTPRLLTHRDGLLFIAKPAGWTTHRSAEGGPDLVDWLDKQGKLTRGSRPVHRLDRDTSGVLLCAHPQARRMASEWFSSGQVHKSYLALVYGPMKERGTISVALDDQQAVTEVVLKGSFVVEDRSVSLVELSPMTGRKHQLRRHLHHIRHPVVGDRRYRRRSQSALPGAPDRMWLHAATLQVPQRPIVEAPLPESLAVHLAQLESSKVKAK